MKLQAHFVGFSEKADAAGFIHLALFPMKEGVMDLLRIGVADGPFVRLKGLVRALVTFKSTVGPVLVAFEPYLVQ